MIFGRGRKWHFWAKKLKFQATIYPGVGSKKSFWGGRVLWRSL